MKVVVTGISGYVGQALLRLLEKDERVDSVVGLDVAEPQVRSTKLEFHRIDIRDPAIVEFLADADVLVHLAFVLNPMQDEALMRDINIDGTKNVLSAIEKSGLGKLIYPSSISAYGARSDNDYPLTEESPLRANPDFSYGEHKLEIERILAEWRPAHPDVTVTIFRMAMVFGPHVQNFMSRSLESPQILTVKGYSVPLQVIHEDDAADAFHFAISHDLNGPYNLCAGGEVPWSEVLEITGKKEMPIPEQVMFPAAKFGWKVGLTEVPSGEVNYLMYRWVMANEKLSEAGFTPTYSNREAIVQVVEANREFVTLGRWRTRKDDFDARVRMFGGVVNGVIAALVIFVIGRRVKKRRERKALASG